jgi:hypothetical protein
MAGLPLIGDAGHHRLAIVHVPLPDAVAAHDDELVLSGAAWDLGDIWLADYELLVVGLGLHTLVIEVPEGTR